MDHTIGLGDAAETAEGQEQQCVQWAALAKLPQAPGDLQQRGEPDVGPGQKEMRDQVQQIEQHHIAAEADNALKACLYRIVQMGQQTGETGGIGFLSVYGRIRRREAAWIEIPLLCAERLMDFGAGSSRNRVLRRRIP